MLKQHTVLYRHQAPECCRSCVFFKFDCNPGHYSKDDEWWFCTLGLFLPAKKHTCKRRLSPTQEGEKND